MNSRFHPIKATAKKVALNIYNKEGISDKDLTTILEPSNYDSPYLSFIFATPLSHEKRTYFFYVTYEKLTDTFIANSYHTDTLLVARREPLRFIYKETLDKPLYLCYNYLKNDAERVVRWMKQKLSCLYKKFRQALKC